MSSKNSGINTDKAMRRLIKAFFVVDNHREIFNLYYEILCKENGAIEKY